MSHKPFIFKHFILQQDKCEMKVGTDAMILGAWVDPGNAEHILDIGAGTGILSLMMAQKTKAMIDAIEINEPAFLQAAENFDNSAWSQRMRIYHSALQDFNPGKSYNLIISNPPYFEENIKSGKESEKYHKRMHARAVSSLTHAELAHHAARLLIENGIFSLILPCSAGKEFIRISKEEGLYLSSAVNILSKQNQQPVRVILSFGKHPVKASENELIIYESKGSYTDEYINLTSGFYAIDMRKRKLSNNKQPSTNN